MMEKATAAAGAIWVIDWNSVGTRPTALRSSRCASTDVLMLPPPPFWREPNTRSRGSQPAGSGFGGRLRGAGFVRQGRLRVSPGDDPDQPTIAGRDQAVGLDVVIAHRLQQLLQGHVGSERLRAQPHDFLGAPFRP